MHEVDNLTVWLGKLADSFWAEGQSHSEHFDYIEYNGGLSMSPNPQEDLRHFKDLLTRDGIIGATYFAKTIHQAALDDMVKEYNATSNAAFSSNPSNLIKGYLLHNGLGHFAKDRSLIDFFTPQKGDGERETRKRAIYSKSQAIDLVKKVGFDVLSSFPTALTTPYADDLPMHYEIWRHKEYGVGEDAFLRYLSPSLSSYSLPV